jgi:hypothetical protein
LDIAAPAGLFAAPIGYSSFAAAYRRAGSIFLPIETLPSSIVKDFL